MGTEKQKSIEELARQKRLEYFRNWRANNKEKVRQHNKNYWLRKAVQQAEKDRKEVDK